MKSKSIIPTTAPQTELELSDLFCVGYLLGRIISIKQKNLAQNNPIFISSSHNFLFKNIPRLSIKVYNVDHKFTQSNTVISLSEHLYICISL